MTSPNRNRHLGFVGAILSLGMLIGGCADGEATTTEPTTDPLQTPATVSPTADPAAGCTTASAGHTDIVVESGGAEYDVRIFVPSSFDGSSELPLVLNFHGFGSTGEQQARFSGYEALAEEEGFIVVHPTGIPGSGDEQARNSWEVADVDAPGKDDVAFVDELIDLLIAEYCVDDERVYVTGMSGGGVFASRLVCDMSDRIAAAVSVAALAYSDTCQPERAVPFMAIHGTEDPTVPFDGDLTGTRFEGEAFAQTLWEDNPIPDQFGEFAAAMGCSTDGQRVQQSTDVTVTTYGGCEGDVPLAFYEVIGGGHAWPSSPLAAPDSRLAGRLAQLQGYTTFEIDATADGWLFMSEHTLDG